MGPDPPKGQEDPDLLNASKDPVTYVKGSSVFSSSDSFALIRGGHLDVSVLGALQVSQSGDIANWCIPGKMMKGIGGAMDLVAGVKRIIVAITHVDKNGKPKILKQCKLPLTGARVVDTIITDLAVFQVKKDGSGLLLTERAAHVTVEEIRAKTEADFEVSPTLKMIQYLPLKSAPEPEIAIPVFTAEEMRDPEIRDILQAFIRSPDKNNKGQAESTRQRIEKRRRRLLQLHLELEASGGDPIMFTVSRNNMALVSALRFIDMTEGL
jgi:3-oxoacid CoA-transferase subunit B